MLWFGFFTVILSLSQSSVWFKSGILTPSNKCGTVPPGHLLPFGYHKEPLSSLDVIPNSITPKEFDELFIQPSGHRPGIFRGLQSNSQAVINWNDFYLNHTFGHYKVLTEVKHENRSLYGKSLNSFSKFLSEYNATNQYVVTVLPDDMRREVLMPEFLQCGTYSQNILELNFWMASGGTASQIHYDADHNVHCLIAGKKSFAMMHPDQYDKLNMERLQHTGSNFCPNTSQSAVDMITEPLVSDVDYQWDILNPGDCIFLPAQYMHQVRSYGRSISVTILWDPQLPLDISSLGSCVTDPMATIDRFHVVWNHKADDIFYDVGYATPHIMRRELRTVWKMWEHRMNIPLDSLDTQEALGWTYNEFISVLFDMIRWELPRCKHTETWVALIGYGLDLNKDQVISPEEITVSSDQLMKAVSHFVDSPNLDEELYDFCEKEFYYLPPEVLNQTELNEIEEIGSVVQWLSSKGFQYSRTISDLLFDFLRELRDLVQ